MMREAAWSEAGLRALRRMRQVAAWSLRPTGCEVPAAAAAAASAAVGLQRYFSQVEGHHPVSCVHCVSYQGVQTVCLRDWAAGLVPGAPPGSFVAVFRPELESGCPKIADLSEIFACPKPEPRVDLQAVSQEEPELCRCGPFRAFARGIDRRLYWTLRSRCANSAAEKAAAAALGWRICYAAFTLQKRVASQLRAGDDCRTVHFSVFDMRVRSAFHAA